MDCDIVCLLVANFTAKYTINDRENEIWYGTILSHSLANMMIKRRVLQYREYLGQLSDYQLTK
jgi:hypothetical protein